MAYQSGFDGTQSDLSSRQASRRPPVITEAEESFETQQRARIRKYALLMSVRIPALVIAVVIYSTWGNVWAALIVVAVSVPLPWIAVLLANDGPPKHKDTLRRYSQPSEDHQLQDRPHPTIEG